LLEDTSQKPTEKHKVATFSTGARCVVTAIFSGGQTGVDQGALRAALSAGVRAGGWCPPGRVCESGVIPDGFELRETPQERSVHAPDVPRSQRTEWNVRDSDATLILRPLTFTRLDVGTDWAIEFAARLRKPLLVCDPVDVTRIADVLAWLSGNAVVTLNVAGPSESMCPGIGTLAEHFVARLLAPGGSSASEQRDFK
jgi:hypothetical protein